MPHFLVHPLLPSSNKAGWAYIVNCSGIMDVLGNGPSEELLMQWRVYRISVKQKQKQKTKLYLLTKGAPFFRREGAQDAIAPRHPGPVRH